MKKKRMKSVMPILMVLALGMAAVPAHADNKAAEGSAKSSQQQEIRQPVGPFVDDDIDDDAPGVPKKEKKSKAAPEAASVKTDAPAINLSDPKVVWLNDLLRKGDRKEESLNTLDGSCGCSIVKVKLANVTVLGDNEPGGDEWRFRVDIGGESWTFPQGTSYYYLNQYTSYPHSIPIDQTLFERRIDITTGQSLGVIFDVEAREIDTFFDDVSRATGAQGMIVPTQQVWYNIVAEGDTRVQFVFELSLLPG